MAKRCFEGIIRNGVKYVIGGNNDLGECNLFKLMYCGCEYSLGKQMSYCDAYFGDGSDGDKVISEDTVWPARTYNLCDLTICSGKKLSFCGDGVPVIKAKGTICNLGTIDLRSCNTIAPCCIFTPVYGYIKNSGNKGTLTWEAKGGAAGVGPSSAYAGNGGGYGENGGNGYEGIGGNSCCCNGGGGGTYADSSHNDGCNANQYCGGNGANYSSRGQGAGGGYGICKGGNGGNGYKGNFSSGTYYWGGGGGGGNAYNSCGGTGGCGCRGGNGGASFYGTGGNGGYGLTCGGNGGFSIWGNGGNGGCTTLTAGKGGDTYYGTGGNGGTASITCNSQYEGSGKGGSGGSALGGQYSIILSAPTIYNTCIIGCGGNGGNGGNGVSGEYAGAGASGKGGDGGDGANIKIFYTCSITCGTICNKGGCGGCGGYRCCYQCCQNICDGAQGCNGIDGELTICQVTI